MSIVNAYIYLTIYLLSIYQSIVANNSEYGLTSGVFTKDINKALYVSPVIYLSIINLSIYPSIIYLSIVSRANNSEYGLA